MFMKLKTIVKAVVSYHITKIDLDHIRIANLIAILTWRRSALFECLSSVIIDSSQI